MPSPARSPLGENDDGLGIMARTDHDDNGDDDDDDDDDEEEEDEVSELRGVKRADTPPCYTKWFGKQTLAAQKTGRMVGESQFLPDPGVSGVRSMGPGLCTSVQELRLRLC